jgi:hypothetical protein
VSCNQLISDIESFLQSQSITIVIIPSVLIVICGSLLPVLLRKYQFW